MRYRSLDAMRGIAALIVAGIHAKSVGLYIEGGAIAVDFFFILSGFVLHHAFFKEWKSSNFGFFARARIIRLAPLNLFMIVLIFGYSALVQNRIGEPFSFAFLSNALLLNNLGFPDYHLNPPSWSISAEMWVGLFFAAFLVTKNRLILFLSLACYIILFSYAGNLHGIEQKVFGFIPEGILRCIGGFGFGYLVYGQFDKYKDLGISKTLATTVELALCLALLSLAIGANYIVYWQFMCIPVFLAVIFVFAFQSGYVSSILLLKPFLFLGAISYSLYLGHYLVMYWSADLYPFFPNPLARLIFYYFSVVFFGWILHRFVEIPSKNFLVSMSPEGVQKFIAYLISTGLVMFTLLASIDIVIARKSEFNAAQSIIEATKNQKPITSFADDTIKVYRNGDKLYYVLTPCTWRNSAFKVFVHFKNQGGKPDLHSGFYFRHIFQNYNGTCVHTVDIGSDILRTGTFIPEYNRSLSDSGVIKLRN